MNKSEQINELAAALSKAQGVIEAAAKNSINPHFGSKYADLASVWEAIRLPLANNGLSVAQVVATEAKRVTVTTVLMHSSGQWISGELSLEARDPGPQAAGSAITYGRRYALAAIVGVAADEDDDGNAAEVEKKGGARKATRPATQGSASDGGATPIDDPKLMLAKFEKQRSRIGDASYSEMLSRHGVTKPEEFRTLDAARACYAAMRSLGDA